MKRFGRLLFAVLISVTLFLSAGVPAPPSRSASLPGDGGAVPGGPAGSSTPGIRIPIDSVGYATSPGQVEAVVALAESLEMGRCAANAEAFPKSAEANMIGAICPHDDYLYAGRVYWHVMREVRAPLAVLVGVSHTARRRGVQGRLVFDEFEAWWGPYGDCPVSDLREEVIGALPSDLVLVDDGLHSEEHSLEAFIPFLQYCDRDIEILPILVTRLGGALFEDAADTLSGVLAGLFRDRGLKLGKDVVILISADCVHYGDESWGGRDYAPFGVGREGYTMGVEQDLETVRLSLAGEVTEERIRLFRERVERNDFEWPYKITWCGVYSIPFGLSVLRRLGELTGAGPPEGFMLRYATSIDPGRLPLGNLGLGVTNINTLRHWVGYTAVGYW